MKVFNRNVKRARSWSIGKREVLIVFTLISTPFISFLRFHYPNLDLCRNLCFIKRLKEDEEIPRPESEVRDLSYD